MAFGDVHEIGTEVDSFHTGDIGEGAELSWGGLGNTGDMGQAPEHTAGDRPRDEVDDDLFLPPGNKCSLSIV